MKQSKRNQSTNHTIKIVPGNTSTYSTVQFALLFYNNKISSNVLEKELHEEEYVIETANVKNMLNMLPQFLSFPPKSKAILQVNEQILFKEMII